MTKSKSSVISRGKAMIKAMNFFCCRESIDDRCSVNLGRVYAGNYDSTESLVEDMIENHSELNEAGILHHEDGSEEPISVWRYVGHEVFIPVHSDLDDEKYAAVIILFYEPLTQAIAA
jgi:hypothetical protein